MAEVFQLTLDLRSYRLSAIKKAGYRIAKRCTIRLSSPEGDQLPVTLEGRSEDVSEFYRELLDQELRELVAEETAPLRTLILAHAFSKSDLIRRP